MGRKRKPLKIVFFRLGEEDKAIIERIAQDESRSGGASDVYRIAVKEFIDRRLSGTVSALPNISELETHVSAK